MSSNNRGLKLLELFLFFDIVYYFFCRLTFNVIFDDTIKNFFVIKGWGYQYFFLRHVLNLNSNLLGRRMNEEKNSYRKH